MRNLLAVVVLAALTAAASAQPGQTAAEPEPAKRPKSPVLAMALSVGTTLGGFALAAGTRNDDVALLGLAAMYVGPSTGQWYGGSIGAPGLAARLAAVALIMHGDDIREDHEFADCLGIDSQEECDRLLDHVDREMNRAQRWIHAGYAVWVLSSLVDVALAYRAAEKWNERNVIVTPTLSRDGASVSIGMRF